MELGTRIEIPTPFEVGPVNCYAFDDDELTLLDPGPTTDEAYHAVASGLDDLGYAVTDASRILITHPHMDHFGLANRIATEADARVIAHTDAKMKLSDPLEHFDREQAFFKPYLATMGVPEQMVDTVVGLPAQYRDFQEPVTVDRVLTDGDVVDIGRELRAVATPGHAPGSVCFVAESANAAFTGDHVLSDVSPNPLLTLAPEATDERTRSLPQYLDSLVTLQSEAVTTGFGGHYRSISNLPGRIDDIRDHHETRKERIADMLAEMGAATAYRIMGEMFPNLPATETFPGMSEVIGHLDLLEDEGRVRIVETDGVKRYVLRTEE